MSVEIVVLAFGIWKIDWGSRFCQKNKDDRVEYTPEYDDRKNKWKAVSQHGPEELDRNRVHLPRPLSTDGGEDEDGLETSTTS